ncbi:hypothetical protein [Paenibacillus tarimensis]|uniref:hypothetical protein n=1 Tax=Paenibacillus tarimensis TaxID=416012 RepID=UPI001F1FAAA5|nr:hypothetical protein [Paenibacillus tarimensis]MCF2943626.1 hypothetical protein [Paenibacillus tarimensis]
MNSCAVDGCDKHVKAKRLCAMHHQRLRRHGDPMFSKYRMVKKACQKNGCEEPVLAKGLCRKHYYFQRRTGQEALVTGTQPHSSS